MAILSKHELDKYQYGTDVQKRHQLYGLSGKFIYDGRWLSRRTDRIIVVEMNAAIAEREALFYLEVNGHKNIIRTLGCIENSMNLTIFIQEFAEHNDLAGVLMDQKFNLSQTILVEMFVQIADAMSYVASKNIVHGDLGCRNILVFQVDPSEAKKNLVKITDFGLARWIENPPANEDLTVIPTRYCAPEILRDNRHATYSEKSDAYSFGVLMWEALSNGEIPYSSIDKDEDVRQKKLNHERLSQPQGCDRQLWVRMNDCWHKDPQQRPTFDEIKDRLSQITISDVPHDLITATSYRAQIHCDYELDINIKIKETLNRGDRSIYEAQWITGDEQRPILLIEQKEEPSVYEKLFYTTFKDHPHIVHTFGFVGNDRDSVMILQERAPHGNLQALLQSGHFQPSAKVLVEIFTQIINAMIDITKQGLVHGDLRCENILVFQMHPSDPKGNSVKLANFTLAHPNDRSYTDERRLFVPVRYCALEILRSAGRSNYSELSDVYSMGVLMWEVYSNGKRPYDSSETNGEVRQRKLNGEKLTRPLLCDKKQIWSIMEDCWHNEPQLRYEFKDMKTRLQSIKPYPYELNKDIKQNRPLSGMNGRFYEAEWIPKKEPPILLYVIDGPTAEDEALLSIKLSSHPCIIHTYGLVENDRQLVMLLQERALHGNLQALLQSDNFQPSLKVLVAIFLQIVDAMIYITDQDIVHGDLRCANVLVFQMDSSEPTRNLVKLTNFSMARRKGQSVANARLPDGYVRYCAPELLRNEDGSCYSELSDVYSMGVLMWEGCTKGEVPYGRHTSDRDVRQQRLNNTKLTQPTECHPQIWSVIEDCYYNEPDLRLTFEQLKVRLDKVVVIDRIYCNRCNKYISANKMNDHQKLCPRKRSIDIEPPHRVHFTRCNLCGERCLGSEIEEHQQSCPERYPPPLHFKCDYCGQECRSNGIIYHQDSCSSRATPPLVYEPPLRDIPCNYCNNDYLDSEIVEHMKCCSRRPPTPVPQWQCDHCGRQYPLTEIENHERLCPPRPKTPPPSPPIYYEECQYCYQEHPTANIRSHEKSCPLKSARPAEPVRRRQCIHCHEQRPLATIRAHEKSCPSKPKSYMEQLSLWLCCCCAKN